MFPPARRPWVLLGAGVVLLAAAVTIHVLVVRDAKPQLWFMIDLDVYKWGGEQARAGHSLYDSRYENYLPFTYPPIAALLFVPLSRLNYSHLKMLVTAGNIVALGASAFVAWGAVGRRTLVERTALTCLVAAAALWFEPVQQTLSFGQINLLLMLFVLADLCRPDAARGKGVGVGIATGIKLTPAIFVLYLLLTRRTRAAAVAVGTFVVTVGVGLVALPDDSRRYWLDHLFLDSRRVGSVAYVGNQSLHGALARLAGSADAVDPWWLVAAVLVLGVGMWTAVQVQGEGHELAGVLLCALTGLLVSPISWSHHWVWVVPALPLAVEAARGHTGPARVVWSATVVAGGLLFAAWFFRLDPGDVKWLPHGLVWFGTHGTEPTGHENVVQVVLGSLYVVLGLGVLTAVAWPRRAALALSVRRSPGTIRRGALRAALRRSRSTPPTRAADLRGSSGR